MSCALCRHPNPRNPDGWFVASVRETETRTALVARKLCSWECMEKWLMIDPTPNEIAALENGGRLGGEYLDSVRCTDLARLTVEQWRCFIDAVVTGYSDHLRNLAARDQDRVKGLGTNEVPF